VGRAIQNTGEACGHLAKEKRGSWVLQLPGYWLSGNWLPGCQGGGVVIARMDFKRIRSWAKRFCVRMGGCLCVVCLCVCVLCVCVFVCCVGNQQPTGCLCIYVGVRLGAYALVCVGNQQASYVCVCW